MKQLELRQAHRILRHSKDVDLEIADMIGELRDAIDSRRAAINWIDVEHHIELAIAALNIMLNLTRNTIRAVAESKTEEAS